MKIAILAILTMALLVTALVYGLNKTLDNRCDYYRTLDMTPAMQEMCK